MKDSILVEDDLGEFDKKELRESGGVSRIDVHVTEEGTVTVVENRI